MFLILTLPLEIRSNIFANLSHRKMHMAMCCRSLRLEHKKPAGSREEIIRHFRLSSVIVHFDDRMFSVDLRALVRWVRRCDVCLDEGGLYVWVPRSEAVWSVDGMTRYRRIRVDLWDRAIDNMRVIVRAEWFRRAYN